MAGADGAPRSKLLSAADEALLVSAYGGEEEDADGEGAAAGGAGAGASAAVDKDAHDPVARFGGSVGGR